MTQDKFIPGMVLNRNFFFDVIQPLMKEHFPGLKYAAGLIANGSDVLGYDDHTSMDHNWGPRMRILLTKTAFSKYEQKICKMLRDNLPHTYFDFPTNYTKKSDGYLKQQMKEKTKGPINHLVRIYELEGFFEHYIGINPRKKLAIKDWLVFPQQSLLEVTSGEVFRDDIGLNDDRHKLAYYPHDVWLYMLHIQWSRLANLLGFPARAGMTDDEFGSKLITIQVVNEVVSMLFLLEKRYMPYTKWRGRAFKELPNGPALISLINQVLDSDNWKKRQEFINKIHLKLVRIHNELGVTKPVPERISKFNNRDFKVVDIGNLPKVCFDAIKTKKLKTTTYSLGAVDQFFNHVKVNQLDYVYKEFKNLVV